MENKLNYLATENHAFFFRGMTEELARECAADWLKDNDFEEEVAQLEDGEESETLNNKSASEYEDLFNFSEHLFQPVNCKSGHVIWYCYKTREDDDLTNGQFLLDDGLMREARECSCNGELYKICIEDNYCLDVYNFETEEWEL